ncbi:hypothetical protein F5Y12DRAFT_205091 [Xylaria sp. FL1777]|nr:hypothetical protein F5Y12DRAFT_205091 [Xylaria sp. FL1777]
MSDQTRTIYLTEDSENLALLEANNMTFQLANSVIDSTGSVSWNVVWQSSLRCLVTEISWKPVYALSWCMNIPGDGFAVTARGPWQPCELGESYDITSLGFFIPSEDTTHSKPDFLNIGRNGFNSQGQGQIHIIVATQSQNGGWSPIWVDEVGLGKEMSAWYQPQEKLQWWYETGVRSSTMISGARSKVNTYDMSRRNPATGKFFVATTFYYDEGKWKDSLTRPANLNKLLQGRNHPYPGNRDDAEDSQLKLVENKIFSIEKMLNVLLRKVGTQFGMAYYGHIKWQRQPARPYKDEKNALVQEYLNDTGRYIASTPRWISDTIAVISFVKPETPPPYHSVPLAVGIDWEHAYAKMGYQDAAEDLHVSLEEIIDDD